MHSTSTLGALALAMLLGSTGSRAADPVAESFERMLAARPASQAVARAAARVPGATETDPLTAAMVEPLRSWHSRETAVTAAPDAADTVDACHDAARAAAVAAERAEQERQFAEAIAALAAKKPAGAYGRLVKLADQGHAPSALMALAMLHDDHAGFGGHWSATRAQVSRWTLLATRNLAEQAAKGGHDDLTE